MADVKFINPEAFAGIQGSLDALNAYRVTKGKEPIGLPEGVQPSSIEMSKSMAFPSLGGVAIKLAENLWGPKPTEEQARQSVLAVKGMSNLVPGLGPKIASMSAGPNYDAIQPTNLKESLVLGGTGLAASLPSLVGSAKLAGLAFAPGLAQTALTGGIFKGGSALLGGEWDKVIPDTLTGAAEFAALHGVGQVGKVLGGAVGTGTGKVLGMGKNPAQKLLSQVKGQQIGATAGRVLGSGAGLGGLAAMQGAPAHEVAAQTLMGLGMGAIGGMEGSAVLKALRAPADTFFNKTYKQSLSQYQEALMSKGTNPDGYIWSAGKDAPIPKSKLTPEYIKELAKEDALYQQKLWMGHLFKDSLSAGVKPGGQVGPADANMRLYELAKGDIIREQPLLKGPELELAVAKRLNEMGDYAATTRPENIFLKNGEQIKAEVTQYLNQEAQARAMAPIDLKAEQIGEVPTGYVSKMWQSIGQLTKDSFGQSGTFQNAFGFLNKLPGVFRELPLQTLESQVKARTWAHNRKNEVAARIAAIDPQYFGRRAHLAGAKGTDPRVERRFLDWWIKENENYHRFYPQALRRLERKPISALEDARFRRIRDEVMIPEFNVLLDKVNGMAAKLGMEPFKKEANYLPFYEDFSSALDLLFSGRLLAFKNALQEIKIARDLPVIHKEGVKDVPKTGEVQKTIFHHESKLKPPTSLATPSRAIAKYIDDVARFEFTNTELPRYNLLTKSLTEAGDILLLPTERLSPEKQLLQQELVKNGVTVQQLEKLANYTKKASDALADIPTSESLVFQDSTVLKRIRLLSNHIFGQMVTTIPTAIRQGYALPALAAQTGGLTSAGQFIKQAFDWERFSTTARKVTEGRYDKLWQKSHIAQSRISANLESPLDPGANIVHKFLRKVVSTADAMLVKTSFVEGYNHYMRNTPETMNPALREAKALEYGDYMAARVNGVYEKWAKPEILRGTWFKLVQPFQTAILAEADSLADTFFRARPEFIVDKGASPKEVRAKRVDALATFIASSFFVNEGIRALTDPRDSEESLGASFTKGLLQHIPFYGVLARGEMGVSIMRPWSRFINNPNQASFAEAIAPWFPMGTYQLQRTMQGTKAVFTGKIKTRYKDGVQETIDFDPMDPQDILRALTMSPKKTQLYQEYAKNSYYSEDPVLRMLEKIFNA